MSIHITDHALVRFLERAGGLDVPALRRQLSDALGRASRCAEQIDAKNFSVKSDGLTFVVMEGNCVTVMDKTTPTPLREPR